MAISDRQNRVNREIFGSDWNSVGKARKIWSKNSGKSGTFGKSGESGIRGFSEIGGFRAFGDFRKFGNSGITGNRLRIGVRPAQPPKIMFGSAVGRQDQKFLPK